MRSFGILSSGNLGFVVLKQLITYCNVKFVFTDSKSLSIIKLCEDINLPCFIGNPRDGKASLFIERYSQETERVDIVISINYLFIIDTSIIDLAKLITFNIHGSLLPKYRGRTPHVWSIINNEKQAGITAHLIDVGCDTGEIIEQIVVDIDEDDTGNSLLIKYEQLYFPLIKSVINRVENNTLVSLKQDNKLATYFNKRTPEDGEINWDWQKERLRNWVRAQAYPYPGAFTYINGRKIIVDELKYVDFGFSCENSNGEVMSVHPFIVKTQNGCIEITLMRENIKNTLFEGLILGK